MEELNDHDYLFDLQPAERKMVLSALANRYYCRPDLLSHSRLVTWAYIASGSKAARTEYIVQSSLRPGEPMHNAFQRDLEEYQALTGLSEAQIVHNALIENANLSGWHLDEQSGLFLKKAKRQSKRSLEKEVQTDL